MNKLENFILSFINIMAIIIFAIIIYMAYTSTLVNIDYTNEFPTLVKDNIFINILVILLIILIFYLLNKFIDKINTNILLTIVTTLVVLISIIWIKSSNTTPTADQYTCAYFAHYFNEGNYFGLNKGEYVAIYTQQLGLISLIRIIFSLFGDYNYRAFQIINALALGLLVISGDMLIRNMHFNINKKKTEIYYLLLMLLCIPLYIYTDFVYGEILTISFMFLTLWMLLTYLNKHKWYNLLICLIAGTISCLVRRNTIIFIIACTLILIIKVIIEHNRYVITSLITIILAGTLSFVIPNIQYGKYIPHDSKEMPSSLYIAMGLRGENGYYEGYNLTTYRNCGFDTIKANDVATKYINERLTYFNSNKDEAYTFFYNKLNIQWNVPMFQCLIMNHEFNGNPGHLASLVYEGNLNNLLNIVSNYYHLFIITTCFIFVIYSFKNRKHLQLEDYIFLVFIIGGFLFSVMWEAKARYILPYFVAMIPYSAIMISASFNKKN